MSEINGEAYISSLDPKSKEFSLAVNKMSEKVANLRRIEGRVPYEIYLASLEMLGVYPCIEVIIRDLEGNLYLKRRSQDENKSSSEIEAWSGKLHIPGTTVFAAKRFEMNFYDLLGKEVVGGSDRQKRINLAKMYRTSKTVGVAIYPEPERKTDALTVFMQVTIDDPSKLQNGFEKVNSQNLDQVIDQHKPTIKKLLQDKKDTLFFDSRYLLLNDIGEKAFSFAKVKQAKK